LFWVDQERRERYKTKSNIERKSVFDTEESIVVIQRSTVLFALPEPYFKAGTIPDSRIWMDWWDRKLDLADWSKRVQAVTETTIIP
jgi:hypothetical protein